MIDPATSGFTGVNAPFVLYGQHCPQAVQDGCGSEKYGNSTVTPPNFKMTADGGIQCVGPPTMSSLAWGYINANAGGATTDDFTHSVTTAFPTANFLMAGTFLRGDQNASSDEDGAAMLLLTGFSPSNLASLEPISCKWELSELDAIVDTDNDMLSDAWEMYYFGTLANGPNSKLDGSNYELLQEYFESTNPEDSASSPATAAGNQLELRVDWPTAYSRFVDIRFKSSSETQNFVELTTAPTESPAGTFVLPTIPNAARQFYLPMVRRK